MADANAPSVHCHDVAPTGISCPSCKAGTLEPARGRYGLIYKCTNKSACKNFLETRPIGEICDYVLKDGRQCRALMVAGTKTIPNRCSDKSCPNRNPHKLPA